MSATAPAWHPDWLVPAFSSPRVRAVMTARAGGVSAPPFDSMNMRADGPLGQDDAQAVRRNRALLMQALRLPPVALAQVHGAAVETITPNHLEEAPVCADASVSTRVGIACEVQVADCLPVLLADRAGRVVGAAHAGWRGLAAGVIEATVRRMHDVAGVMPGELEAWLGACIGPRRFEVGPDVLAAFGADPEHPGARFRPNGDAAGKWLADLPGLARDRLAALGVACVAGNDGTPAWCTVDNPLRFFSFRRDGVTGRMSACIGLVALA